LPHGDNDAEISNRKERLMKKFFALGEAIPSPYTERRDRRRSWLQD